MSHHVLAWWDYNEDTDEDEIFDITVSHNPDALPDDNYTVLGSYATLEEAERHARFYRWWMLEEVE